MALTRLKGNQIFDDTITIADLAVADGSTGQALLTDGSGTLTFGDVDALPTQSGSAGKFLKTDGTTATWEDASASTNIPTPDLFAGGTHPGQNTFTLSTDPGSANAVQVWVDDVLQRPATNYTVIGTQLSFTSVPANSADIYVVYEGEALSIGTVADASITSAKLANFSITVDKLAIANFATPETFTGVTNQTSFVLAMNPGSAYAIFVYLNTVFQRPGPDYTLTTASGITSLIFTTAPAAGDEIYVRYGMQAMPSGITSIADGTITIAKFAPATFLVDSFVVTASAGQQDFTLSRNPGSVYALFVVVEGIIQKPITHYTVSGTTLSFASVLPIDSEVEVHLNGFPSPLNAPADATVGRLTLLTTNSSASGLVLKVSSNNTDLEWGTIVSLPTQTGQSGKYLTTDGTNANWSTITHPDEIPGQTSNAGKFLTTDGSVISWATVAQYTLPTQSGQSGKYLTTDGTSESWGIVDALPAQTSHSGKFLTTDGSVANWADVPAVTVSDTPPGSPSHSDLWWDSVLGKLKIYYNDGTSSQWVDAHQIGSIDPSMGGDLSGVASNAQIVANKVGITELIVTDGTVGQALTTDGSGTLGFADAGASVTISDTAPGSASAGDLWWKSDTGRLKVYYDDGSGVQWVDAFPVGSIDPAMGGDLTGTTSNAQIAAGAVGTAEIATDAVTSNEIATDAVTTGKINSDVVTDREIAANAVGVTELATTLDLSSNTITLPAASVTAHITPSYSANRNVMINGQFDVWQRGTSFVYGTMTAHNYYMDRFRHEGAAWTGSVTQQTFTNGQTDVPGNPTYYARWIISAANAGGVCIIQRLENYPLNKHSGKTYTASVWLKSVSGTISAGDVSIYGGGALGAITTTWQKFTKTTTVATQGAAYGPSWGISVPTTVLLTSGLDIANFQVEEGSDATDFEQKSFAETLAECQRYYQKSYNIGTDPGTASSGAGSTSSVAIYSSGSQHLGDRFPTRMRATPTITIYSPGTGASGNSQAASNNADIATSAGEIGESGFQFVTGGLPTGDNGMRWQWTADAEF